MPNLAMIGDRASCEYYDDSLERDSETPSAAQEEKGLLPRRDDSQLGGGNRKLYSIIRSLPLILSVLFFIAGISVWGNVLLLVKNFHCGTLPAKDNFEPDLVYSSRVTFQPHLFYGGRPSNATNEMWQRLQPPGDGIVSIPRKYATDLHPSFPNPRDPDSLIYGVSMFHQLHCLNFLRFAYWPETITSMSENEVSIHRDHCLDYIRQALMCFGDATFETMNEHGVLDGMGATHQCRNFDLMFSWAYENRPDKENGSSYKPEEVITHTPAKQNDFGGP